MDTEQCLTVRDPTPRSPDRTRFQTWEQVRLAWARRFRLRTPPPAGDRDARADFDWGWVDSLCLLGLAGLVALMSAALSWKMR